MALYGPTLMREFITAGLGSLVIAVTSDTIIGWDALTPEQQADLQVVIDAHDPEAAAPRYLPRKIFYEALAAEEKYDDFMTWKGAQNALTRIHFDEEPGFFENDTRVAGAMTALSTTPSGFFTTALP